MASKVFGIGLSRSGTSSLTEALKILGYSAIHSPTRLDHVRKYDASTDTIVADNFERFDQLFPGSKFIYTIRPLDLWLSSCERFWMLMQSQFNNSFLLTELHKQLYDSVAFDRAKFSLAYEKHTTRVEKYFKNRQTDLLVFDVSASQNPWTPLCSFLNKSIPGVTFPRTHSMQVIETCLLKMLDYFGGDVALVSKLSKASPDFLELLKRERPAGSENRLINPEGSFFIRELTVQTCIHVGSALLAAKILGFEPDYVSGVLQSARIRKRRLWVRRARLWIRSLHQ